MFCDGYVPVNSHRVLLMLLGLYKLMRSTKGSEEMQGVTDITLANNTAWGSIK